MAKKKDTTVYTHISETVNNVTGEVVSTKKDEVIRREKTPQFIMLFTEGAPDLVKANLTKSQSHVLWKILEKYTHTGNSLKITTATKKIMAKELNLTLRTVGAYIRVLIHKNVIQELDIYGSKDYFLNPHIFGRGEWNNIKKLRYETTVEFNFEKNEAQTTRTTKSTYKDADKLTEKPHQVVEVNSHKEQNGTLNQTVVVEEIEDKNSNLELDFLKEKNREKELSIKELELKIKAYELGL